MNLVNMGFNEMIILSSLLLGPVLMIGLPVLVVLLIILMLRRGSRSAAGLSAQELEILTQLEQGLARMERRIENLEVILNEDVSADHEQRV